MQESIMLPLQQRAWKKIFGAIFLLLLGGSCAHPLKSVQAPARPPAYLNMSWSRNSDPDYETGNLPIALVSPSIHQGILYAGGPNGEIAAYHLENGRKLWWEKHQGDLSGSIGHFGNHILYTTDEGRVYSRDALTGKLDYMVDVGEASETRPAIDQGRAIFHLRNHKLVCIDAETGKILWSYKRSISLGQTLQGTSSSYIHEKTVYVGLADGSLAAFSLDDGELLWEKSLIERTKFVDVDMTPFPFQNWVWAAAFDGPLKGLNAQKGTIENSGGDINVTASLLLQDGTGAKISGAGHLILGTQGGELVLLNEKNFPILRQKISNKGISSIVPWKDKLAVGTLGGMLLVVDPKNLQIIQKMHLGHRTSAIYADLVVGENHLAVQSSRHRLYVFH